MKKTVLKAIITGGKEQFGVWVENLPGVYGAGDTLEEVKESLKDAIELFKETNEDVLKGDYEIKFNFDTSGFLKYYSKFISFAAMKEITGVHQKQLWNYANHYRTPSRETSEKITEKIKAFAKDIGHVQITF